jgi:hypothetical protein
MRKGISIFLVGVTHFRSQVKHDIRGRNPAIIATPATVKLLWDTRTSSKNSVRVAVIRGEDLPARGAEKSGFDDMHSNGVAHEGRG